MNTNNDPEKTTLGHVDVTMALLSHERLSNTHTQTYVCATMYMYMKRKTDSDGDIL